MARTTKAITIDKDVADRLAQVCYDRRTPMVSLASNLLRRACDLLDMGALCDPNNLTAEGLQSWEEFPYQAALPPGRKPHG